MHLEWSHPRMNENVYLIRFKLAAISPQTLVAATAEIHGEHLVLLNDKGQINALFLMDTVESWSELPSRRAPRKRPC
jgi:hypothetical protein